MTRISDHTNCAFDNTDNASDDVRCRSDNTDNASDDVRCASDNTDNASDGVTIIIPAHNEAHRLARCLETALSAARARGWRVVVVDDGSTDDTARIAGEMGAAVLQNPSPLGVAAARNRGARHTESSLLIFVDADIVALPNTLHKLADHLLQHPEVHATGAYPELSDLSPAIGARFVGLRASMPFLLRPREDIVGFSSFQSECGAIRRAVFDELGGFSEAHAGVGMEEFRMGHDMERRGYVNIILADAPYHHHYKDLLPRCRELFHRTSRWVPLLLERGKLESTGAVGTWPETTSCLLTHLMVAGALAGLIRPRAWAIAGSAATLQLALEWRFLRLARQAHGPGMMFYAWPALQLIHLSIGLGFATGIMRLVASKWVRNRTLENVRP